MQATSAAFKTTVAGNDMSVDYKVTVTLPGNVYPDLTLSVQSVKVDGALTTDMPDGTRLITGYPTRGATVVLAGLVDPTNESKTAAWLFGPYKTDSPLYRLDAIGSVITIDAGVYTINGLETVRAFTGSIDDVIVDDFAGTVTLDCLDKRNTLRTSPALPAVASPMDVPDALTLALDKRVPGLTSAWVMDSLLRANGYYASPGPRAGCAFYASMNGSAFPQTYAAAGYPIQATNYGSYVGESYTSSPMVYVPGMWAASVCRDPEVILASFVPANRPSLSPGGGYHFEYAMNATAPSASVFQGGTYPTFNVSLAQTNGSGTVLNSLATRLSPVAGTTWQFDPGDGTFRNVTLAVGWHVYDVQVTVNPTTVVTTMWQDGIQIGTWTMTASIAAGIVADATTVASPYPIEAFQITNETAGVPRATFVPNAVLDASLNTLTATVDITGQDPWVTIQHLAQAEQGIAGFDENGVFRFTNRKTLQSNASVRSITSTSSLSALQFETGASTIANCVIVPLNALARSAFTSVWSAPSVYVIAPGSVASQINVTFSAPVVGLSTLTEIIPSGGFGPTVPWSGYRAARNQDGSGGAITNLTVYVQQVTPTTATITIVNPNAFPVYLVTPSGAGYPAASVGQPALQLGGEFVQAAGIVGDSTVTVNGSLSVLSEWPPTSEGGSKLNARGQIALPVTANPWIQDVTTAQTLANDLLADLYKPRPLLRNVSIVADPSLQLGDRVTLTDPDGSRFSDDALITAITTTFDASTWTQVLTLRAVATPGGWIMGQAGRSEMGVATYV